MKVFEPLSIGGLRIEAVDYRSMPDEQIAVLNAFQNAMGEESHPEDPPEPVEQAIAFVRNLPDIFSANEFWGLDGDGRLRAEGYAFWTLTDDNRHLAQVGLAVLPEYRRRGIGTRLLGLLTDVIEADGRSLLVGQTVDRVPAGEAFARRVGAEVGMETHTNRLLLSELDPVQLGEWVEQGPVRAPEYTLVWMDSPYPDDFLPAAAEMMDVMNTAPRDDLQMEDRHFTAEELRQWETSMMAGGTDRWSLYVRHEASGVLAGFTTVGWNASQPNTIWQYDTGVRPEHRGHALGKWLKAAMLDRILTQRPQAIEVRTGNADSNAAMLGINRALGFRPYMAHIAWQAPVDRIRTYVSGSSS